MNVNVLDSARLSAADIERLAQGVDPTVRLVPPRVVRRVIKRVARIPGLGLQVPHRKSFSCTWAAYVNAVDGLAPGVAPAGNVVLLLEQPSRRALAALSPSELVLRYWRRLFHAHIHGEIERRIEEGRLTSEALNERLRILGPGAFDEIRSVLGQEKLLLAPHDDREVYKEFAAVYLELRHFLPPALPLYFPSVAGRKDVEELLARDVDAPAVLERTRLPGARDPGPAPVEAETELFSPAPARNGTAPAPMAPARSDGNAVGTAIQQMAEAISTEAAILPAGARAEIDKLAGRLGRALQLDEAEVSSWAHALSLLVGPAARGLWSAERRLLYDLQRVCLDAEREVYALDLVGWALSRGRRPIRRLLPGQGHVLALKHLRRAWRRLPSVALSPPQRFALAALLEAAIDESAERVRQRYRPVIHAALDGVSLCPQNFPERVASNKLTEELLDRIVARGFLNLGDLRDALSRNQLKLPDLGGMQEFFHGDALLRADRWFAQQLDGVYRRGEVYLRGLQRLSSVAFGTQPGRIFTRFVALPLGGAFFILEGLQHLVEPMARLFVGHVQVVPPEPIPESEDPTDAWTDFTDAPPVEEHAAVHLLNSYSFVAVSVFLFALLHFPAFRAWCGRTALAALHGIRWLVLGLPYAVLQLPWVCRVLNSRPVQLFKQLFLKPLLLTVPIMALLAWLRAGLWLGSGLSFIVFVAATVLVNSRLGRDLEESLYDWLVRTWRQFHADLLPGLFWWIASIFKRCLEGSERVLYAVDEWLRFRTGDGPWAVALKPALALVWFFLTYLIRIFINLFVEPTVNPIKHFPVVTVAAKLILPIIPLLGRFLSGQLQPLVGRTPAGLIAALVIFFLPGLAGFLVWEFKENWKLYRANRPRTLRRAVIGHHGETMLRLLRPGFHSGTIPKQYAKLRKALRQAQRHGSWRSFRKQRDALHHVEEALRHFVERELLFVLNESKGWSAPHVTARAIELCTNRVTMELACPALNADPVELAFRLESGRLTAAVEPGWLRLLPEEPRRIMHAGLMGLYTLSGVDGVGEIAWTQWIEAWEREETGHGIPDIDASPSACHSFAD